MVAPDIGAEPARQIGPYRVVKQLGRGGMAVVLEGEDVRLGQRVAIKQLHPHVAERSGAAARFLREGRAAAAVRHPHIVQVLTLGDAEGVPYLAMELLDGEDLGALLRRGGRLSAADALDLLVPIVAAVAAAHHAGIIHRDLKPSNIFIARGPGGRPWPKVVDFGISKLTFRDDEEALTASGAIVGTVAYMAPEQARALKNASFASDQYALAVVLYECLVGSAPFQGESLIEVLQAVMTAPVASPCDDAPGLPRELGDIVLRAMQRAPGERYPSLRAFGAALLPFASGATRATWSDELFEVTTPISPGLTEGDRHHRADAVDDAEGTMRGTLTVSTREVASAPRLGLRRFRNASGIIGIVAAALGLGVAAVRPDPTTVTAVAAATSPSASPSAPPSSRAPAPIEEAPRAAHVAPLAAASASTPGRPASRPPVRGRTAPPPTPAQSASAPPASSPPSRIDVGDNGAPILP